MFAIKDRKQQPSSLTSASKSRSEAPSNFQKQPLDSPHLLQRSLGNQHLQALSQTAGQPDGVFMQRACACGGSCAGCMQRQEERRMLLQAKLVVGEPNDQYEQEADRVADQVMRMPAPKIQRLCPECEEDLQRQPMEEEEKKEEEETLQTKPLAESITPLIQRQTEPTKEEEKKKEEEETLQTKTASGEPPTVSSSLENQITALQSGGQPLPQSERNFFEPRFGADFSQVRIHADTQAAETASAVNARAFTLGRDVVFGAGQYQPGESEGRRLLAHELTHVIQQGRINYLLQRTCNTPSYCPRDFCRPFRNRQAAIRDRDDASAELALYTVDPTGTTTVPISVFGFQSKADLLLLGISLAVNPRVVPLWRQHIFGGAAPQNLSSQFANDFTNSPTTATTTNFLVGELRSRLERRATHLRRGPRRSIINLGSYIRNAIREINNPGSSHEMNFNMPTDIAGNLAGGIGRNQTSCRMGRRPSPFNDSRIARGTATVTRDASGNLTVTPSIRYSVRDTIDLCPGDCGNDREWMATVPISRWEASGISGDIPFTVNFPAPLTSTSSFVISSH